MSNCLTINVTSGSAANMQVTNLTVSPASVQSGQSVTLTTSVKNTGSAASGTWRVKFTITPSSGSVITANSATYNPLSAGSQTAVATSVSLSGVAGAYQICAAIG